jgi:hypothetical protein
LAKELGPSNIRVNSWYNIPFAIDL